MEQRREKRGVKSNTMVCFCLFVMVILLCAKIEAYKNYTVGDSLGWYDNLVKPDVDYDHWLSGKTFSLGDFLLFNTDNNHSVVQTHSFTTYKACDTEADNTILWSTINPNSTLVQPVTVPVPLIKEGPNYFFSGDYDGEQCMHGQKFQINVTHGQGLPPSIRDNPEFGLSPSPASNAAPGPADPESGDDQSVPETTVPANFDHPKKLPQDSSDGDGDGDGEEGETNKSNDASVVNVTRSLLGYFGGGLLILFWAC